MFRPWSSWWDVRVIVAVFFTLVVITLSALYISNYPDWWILIIPISGVASFGMGCLIGAILKENDLNQ